ncbi:hypothetical protein PHPALM_38075 [Phytophthora palmivora]|uniref:Uncharacterized protein n=1 Tax=Phytophthora palmivora TaxID=4796 RepID=A0A2P4WVU0_9STRA|nr:hypothetical protein PHPALM_38075 [Phytophthora palmivora]
MVDKSELVAFEREKRLYKDAYVENFRSVRYFPSLAMIGTGQTDGGSIVLVQEPPPAAATVDGATERSRFNDVAKCLISPDSLDDVTLPLTMFRSAIMSKHTKARRERRAAERSSASSRSSAAPFGRHLAHCNTQPGVFKPTSVVEAKGAIQRKVTYDGQPFEDKPRTVRSVTPRADAKQTWAINNPASARKEICGRTFFNMPPEGAIKADRKYTQEFIRLSMEAHLAGRRAASDSVKGDLQRDH